MRICLDIEFAEQDVVILGGGNVALRKARQYTAAGARVFLYSPRYLPAFDVLSVCRVSRGELSRRLRHARLAIACTDSRTANEAFMQEASDAGILAMCAMKDAGQNTHSMTESHAGLVKAAFSTDGAFPLACSRLAQTEAKRIALLGTIRDALHDRSLCRPLADAGAAQLRFLEQAMRKRCALVFLMHGSSGALAEDEAEQLACKAGQFFPDTACGWLFTGRSHQTLAAGSLLRILQDLAVRAVFCPLFWETGTYAEEAAAAVRSCGFPLVPVRISPSVLLEQGETPLLHTRGTPSAHSVLVSLLYSPWLRQKHPSLKYRVLLEDPRAVEDILEQLRGSGLL